MAEDGLSPSLSMCSLNRMPATAVSHHGCERGLADLKRLAAEVVVVQLDDVEAVRNTRSSVRF